MFGEAAKRILKSAYGDVVDIREGDIFLYEVQVGDKSLDIQIKYRREGEEIHVKEIDGVDEDGNHINLTDATDPELGDMNEWATKKVECDEDVSEEVREWIREQERKEQADWDRHHPGIGRYRG